MATFPGREPNRIGRGAGDRARGVFPGLGRIQPRVAERKGRVELSVKRRVKREGVGKRRGRQPPGRAHQRDQADGRHEGCGEGTSGAAAESRSNVHKA